MIHKNKFKTVRISKYYQDRIAKGLRDNIWETMFKPIFEILNNKNSVLNAKQSALIAALDNEKIYYENGAFKAVNTYSNAVATELESLGATFKRGAYYLERSLLPVEVESTLAIVAARESAKISALNALLAKLAVDITKDQFNKLLIEHASELMFKKLEKDLKESTSRGKVTIIGTYYEVPDLEIADEKINELNQYYENGGKGNKPEIDLDSDVTGVNPPPTASEEAALKAFKQDKWTKKIAKDYVYNMKFWVKKWKAKEIIKMRRDVLEMVQAGARTETIKKYFETRWPKAKDKAAFLARNESNIANSVIKAIHYQSQGCTHFFWLKSVSREKRELHLEYAKEKGNKYGVGGTNIFPYDNPPIIEELKIKKGKGEYYVIPKPNGQRGLPGQTYNCECDQLGVTNPEFYVNRSKIENAKRNFFTKLAYRIKNSLQRNNYPWRYRRFGEGQTF